MKKLFIITSIILSSFASKATIHIVKVWDGYYQFLSRDITIQLGDTVQWLPLGGGPPIVVHTITSTNIPSGAEIFDQIWQAPADTFFQYVPQIAGLYEYECTPHAITFGMIGSITVYNGTTAINDNISKQNNSLIYPNPATNFIRFNEWNTISTYKIYAINGDILLTGKTKGEVDISTLVNGMYFIEIIGDSPRIGKIIKQ